MKGKNMEQTKRDITFGDIAQYVGWTALILGGIVFGCWMFLN